MNNKELLNYLNYKTRAYRLALGLTQEEVADMVGISGVSVCLYERGVTDSDYADKIMAVLDDVCDRMTEKYGYWYKSYIALSTSLNEIKVWTEFNGHVPEDIIRQAKDHAVTFSNT